MPNLTRRPPALQPTERELSAFACIDAHGVLFWVRVFESSITRRSQHGLSITSLGRRYETPNGWPVHQVDGGLYLVFCERTQEWLELEALDSFRR